MDFATLLHRHRKAARLTQEQLAAKSGLSLAAIGALERGVRRYPRQATVDTLAYTLGLSADERKIFAGAARRRGGDSSLSSPESARLGPRAQLDARPPAAGPAVPRQLPLLDASFTGRAADLAVLREALTGGAAVAVTAAAATGGSGVAVTDGAGVAVTDGPGVAATSEPGTTAAGEAGTAATGGADAAATGVAASDGIGVSATGGPDVPATSGPGMAAPGGNGTAATDVAATGGADVPVTGGPVGAATGRTGAATTGGTGVPVSGRADVPTTSGSGVAPAGRTGVPATGGAGVPTTGRAGVVVMAVTGMGGVGKTALAVHAAHAAAEDFPDGQVYLDLRGYGAGEPVSPLDALDSLLRAFGLSGPDVPLRVDEAAARLRTLLANRRALILLDNARDAAHVEHLLPGTGRSAVIITSRYDLTGMPIARILRLGLLSASEGLGLLRTIVGETRVAHEPTAAQSILASCGLLPLALKIAAGRLAARPHWPLSHLANLLRDERRRLDQLEDHEIGVRTSFDVSIEDLDRGESAREQRAVAAFALFGVPDGPDLSVEVAAKLLNCDERTATDALEDLCNLHLVESLAPRRYRLHDLLRMYARERAQAQVSAADRAAAITRIVDLHAAIGWRAVELCHPTASRLPWFKAHPIAGGGAAPGEPALGEPTLTQPVLDEPTLTQAAPRDPASTQPVPGEPTLDDPASGGPAPARPVSGGPMLDDDPASGAPESGGPMLTRPESERSEPGGPTPSGPASGGLAPGGPTYTQPASGDPAFARTGIGGPMPDGTASDGPVFGDLAGALAWLDGQRAHLLALIPQAARTPGVPAVSVLRLAISLHTFYATRGHWLDALRAYRTALEVAGDDPAAEGFLRSDLGLVLHDLAKAGSGDTADAVAELRRSLTLFEDLEDYRGAAMALANLSHILDLIGDFEQGIECGERAITLYRKSEDPLGEALAYISIGNAEGKLGRTAAQRSAYDTSIAISTEQGSGHHLAIALFGSGLAYRQAGDFAAAFDHLRQSAANFKALNDQLGLAEALDELGVTFRLTGDRSAAIAHHEEALAIAVQYDDGHRRLLILEHLELARG
ncbi:NB-ARC domain-containing protein [Kribbella sp. NPDC056861]|uniref:NB-ARC domain-containing protein n=1 Tax=Kribbella sp. NPDC056861 TaxID=3154857 RepID=UPI003433849E